MEESKILELIKRRRLQMLVHSYLYEELNENVISDSLWDKWAKELANLQDTYPELSKKVPEYYNMFIGWTGDTASCLTYDKETIGRAYLVLRLHQSRGRS